MGLSFALLHYSRATASPQGRIAPPLGKALRYRLVTLAFRPPAEIRLCCPGWRIGGYISISPGLLLSEAPLSQSACGQREL